MNKRNLIVISMLIIFIVNSIEKNMGVVSAMIDLSKGNIERVYGNTRVETSVEVSRKAYPEGADVAVIVGYDGDIDALSGTILAVKEKGPILITEKGTLNNSLKSELQRLRVRKVYILGGLNAVSSRVERSLISMNVNVDRIAGVNRADTSAMIAQSVSEKGFDNVFIAPGWPLRNGDSLADALAVSSASGMMNWPILLTQKNRIPFETVQALQQMNVKNITIVGGYDSVSGEVENMLRKNYNVSRISGDNREHTSTIIAERFFPLAGELVFVNGYAGVDALFGGYLGAMKNAPIIFVRENYIDSSITKYLDSAGHDKGYVIGGKTLVSEDTREDLMNRLIGVENSNAPCPINIETPKPFPSSSGQTTHPDVVYVKDGWNGHKYWMAHTPYHNTMEELENPSVSYSDDGINFKTLKGATNPIDSPKDGLVTRNAHMSDADMLIKPDGTMEVYYRYRDRAKNKGETIYRKTSVDGVSWTDREIVIRGYTNTGKDLLSPALIYESGEYRMWWVDQTGVYTSTSKTAKEGSWSKRKKVKLQFDGKEMTPWHLDITKEDGFYYLLLNVNEDDVHSQRSLVIGDSVDGVNFNNTKTIMRPRENHWDNRDIYRGSIVKVGNTYKLYYSAMNKDRTWYVGLSESKDMLHWQGVAH